jgi:hypothetical protein
VASTDKNYSAKEIHEKRHAPLLKRQRGRPRKNWAFHSPSMSCHSISSTSSVTEKSVYEKRDELLNIEDMELFFHYLNHTAPSSTDDCTIKLILEKEIPRIGLSHSFVLSFLLSLSALHLERLQPERRQPFTILAEKQLLAGYRGNTTALASLTKENGQAVYISAVLACYSYLAKGPTPNERLLFS